MNFNLVRIWPVAARYAAAISAIMITIAVCSAIGGAAAERPFIPLYFATLLTAVLAGPGPGVLATVLSALLGDYFFLAPIGSLAVDASRDVFRLAVFEVAALLSILGVAWYGHRKRAELKYVRRQADESLRESEERYRLLFETSRDGVITWDQTGQIQDANPAFQTLTGYALDELRQLTCHDITPSRWHAAEDAIITHRVLPHADSGEYEKEFVHKDGSVFAVSLRAWPVYDGRKNIVGLRAFVRDITERKRAEEALKVADRRKDEFLATLAHELRNPLAPIRNAVHVLKQLGSHTEERDRKLLAIADRQVQHLIRLVDDLLDFSRISRGKVELIKEKVDLSDVLRHAIETAQPVLQSGGHEFITELPEEPITIDGDAIRLAQVFANLLDNAAKYTEHGGSITLTAERRGSEAVVTIRDSGVGIPGEMLPEIFTYFAQVDRTLGRARGGLGIGLALVRSLLQLHGGTVEAHSEGEGCGSVFTVRLPALSESASLRVPPALPLRATRRVLIIDDEIDVADSFAALLEGFGATTRVAYGGETGVALARSFQPDLVLLDLGMPAPDGFETARRIRALTSGGDITIVALSGWGKEQVEASVEAAGFDGHLTKPAELRALNELLGSLEKAVVLEA
jgi:PAS domain S-box-containing protein